MGVVVHIHASRMPRSGVIVWRFSDLYLSPLDAPPAKRSTEHRLNAPSGDAGRKRRTGHVLPERSLSLQRRHSHNFAASKKIEAVMLAGKVILRAKEKYPSLKVLCKLFEAV